MLASGAVLLTTVFATAKPHKTEKNFPTQKVFAVRKPTRLAEIVSPTKRVFRVLGLKVLTARSTQTEEKSSLEGEVLFFSIIVLTRIESVFSISDGSGS